MLFYTVLAVIDRIMDLKELIEKYANEECEFRNLYKGRVIYECKKIGLRFFGTVEYRDDLSKNETVWSLSQLEDFSWSEIRTRK